MNNGGLRFAPIIRVSTEAQEKRGESLRTQEKQILNYVKILNGVIPERCWKYSGQEHATPDQERKKLDQLLTDASKDLFDAVIVCDASRWSRDNLKSKQGLKILRENGTRFFVGTSEFDLSSPEHSLFLGMATEMNEFFAWQQSLKSTLNRIERAKAGIPTGGKLPFARVYDKATNQWGLNEKEADKIRWAADQYLQGESLLKIAKTLGMNASNLWKILTKRSGEDWRVRFDSARLSISETVEIKIPPLLPKKTINLILKRAASNKTYTHGHVKHQYLLSRMVMCGHCGYAMFGQTNHSGKRYYRHARNRVKECDVGFWVPADDLENAVLAHLFRMYGDVNSMEKAMRKAIPNKAEMKKLRDRRTVIRRERKKTDTERKRLVNAIAKGILSDSEASEKLEEIRNRKELLSIELDRIEPQLEKLPTEKQMKRKAKLMERTILAVYGNYPRLSRMSYEDKRKMVQTAFDGTDPEGNRCGVYVTKPEIDGDPKRFTIKGLFGSKDGKLPLTPSDIREILGVEKRYDQDFDPFEKKSGDDKLNLLRERHAHHRFGVHQRRRIRPPSRLRCLA